LNGDDEGVFKVEHKVLTQVLDNNVVVVFRKLILLLAIEVIIINATNADNSCITEETKVQFGLNSKIISDNHYKNNVKKSKNISHQSQQLDWICSRAFVGLENLETLDLSKNRLTHLMKNTFKPLHNIKEINLIGNQLTTISFDEFAENLQLKKLYLGFNKIQIIEPILHKSGFSITSLGFYGNNLMDASELCKLTKLKILGLSHNQNIDFKTFNFTCWSELRQLFLKNSSLKRLHNDYHLFTGLTKLKELHLPNNNLEVLCVRNFPEFPELYILDVADNQLQTLDANDINSKFPQLRQIAVSKNLWSCDYFKMLETELKKMKINIAFHSTETNCIKGSNTTERSSSKYKCGTTDYEVATELITHFALPIALTLALVIVDIVLSFYFVRH
jgi:Leucine-rich repeat (LRR) protein